MKPRVTVAIPCFNAERWIAQAIESALGQTCPDKEVIVVDDGSTDKSLEIIRSFGQRVRYGSGPNRGANVARNRLLEMAAGEWLQYLDADDYLLPDKIAKQVEFIREHADADVVYGPVTLERSAGETFHRELLTIPEPRDPWVLLARWYLPQTGASLWRKQALIDVAGWKVDQPCCQEHQLYLRFLMAGKKFAYCEHNGAVYRHWSENTLWRGKVPEVHRQRLIIEEQAESFLRSRKELTPERHWAINMARFETARSAWQYNRRFALEIINAILQSDPSFSPSGSAAPVLYRIAFRSLGFRLTEELAEFRRKLFGPRAPISPA